MTLEESYQSIGEDLDLENLDGVPLEELRRIRRAMGHDVEASEREFLALLRSRGLLQDAPTCQCGHGKGIHTHSGCDSLYCGCDGFVAPKPTADAPSR